MEPSILIVEDEYLIALEMQSHLEDVGYRVVGIAGDLATALKYAGENFDLALVDLNLRDGLTGPEVGRLLAEKHGVAVLFVTANPSLLGAGISGTVGVLTKPTDKESLCAAVAFALDYRLAEATEPPSKLRLFG
jgi:DNA-binding response OmpR family regulator